MESKNTISENPKIKSKLIILNKMNKRGTIEIKKIIKCFLEFRKSRIFLNLSLKNSMIIILFILSLS